ncbi:hypothetical protein [Thauera linaloolentis]|uniref:Uncharacterized protein n=1 Tax=Thauera linaloolentis (strain DSM 12138 / JCM 21573 / CCUG 41526 / CIP 105981 / IAM 15112 / NBRC 102519 / 47Lol) TaxID=1123367 RepID=N6Y245_THAL4|nr:hypothetical protein [Thauera linaloolentis]ENO88256.1 hypothetical protein C666_09350 [Thauera linaloolentis 47Lol = DSM 12138]MCM8566827.1 hypothetical protein [Thauera linaloolentis]
MATKQRLPYFKVAFPGPVDAVSDGMWESGWRRRAYIDLGPYRLRDLVTDPQMDCVLDEAGGDPDSVIRLGHFLTWRWLLSVTREGRTERQEPILFILSTVTITLAFAVGGFICLFFAVGLLDAVGGGLLHGLLKPLSTMLLGLGLPLVWAVHMVMNFRAWSGS